MHRISTENHKNTPFNIFKRYLSLIWELIFSKNSGWSKKEAEAGSNGLTLCSLKHTFSK